MVRTCPGASSGENRVPALSSDFSTPPNDLAVVGENKDDPEHLLSLRPDGTYYAYSLPEGNPQLVTPDDHWDIEVASSEELFT